MLYDPTNLQIINGKIYTQAKKKTACSGQQQIKKIIVHLECTVTTMIMLVVIILPRKIDVFMGEHPHHKT